MDILAGKRRVGPGLMNFALLAGTMKTKFLDRGEGATDNMTGQQDQ